MLIILSKSPQPKNCNSILEIAENIVENEAAVLFIQDACIAATMSEYCSKLTDNKIKVHALKADCEARGLIEKLLPKVKVVDYKQWVELVMTKHEKIVSWTS